MKWALLLLFLISVTHAGEMGLYIIYPSSFTATEMNAAKDVMRQVSDIQRQPAAMMQFVIPVGTNIAGWGLLHVPPEIFQVDERSEEILLQLNTAVENKAIFQTALVRGLVQRVATRRWDRHGYIRDSSFQNYKDQYHDFCNKFSVIVSTE